MALMQLPHSEEAEKIVLGSMMLEPDRVISLSEGIIEVNDFFNMKHRDIYKAITKQFYAGRAADIIGVTQYLRDTERLDKIGGPIYLSDLISYVTTTASFEHYVQMVVAASRKRKIINAGNELLEIGYHSEDDIPQMQEKTLEVVNRAIIDKNANSEIKQISELEPQFIERLQAEKNTGRPEGYLTTGFKTLDNRISDLRGQLTLIAGSSSTGKSLTMLNMAYKQAKKGIKVGIISLEMTNDAIMNRLLIRHMLLPDKQRAYKPMDIVRKAAGEILILPIWLVSLGASSLFGIMREMRQMVLHNGIQCIYLDYLQLIGDVSSQNRATELESITRTLLLFTKKHNIGLVIGSQFNREVMGTSDKRPRLWMLRGSGGIENNVDVAIGLFRPEYADAAKTMEESYNDKESKIEIHWLKNRNDGRSGIIDTMNCSLEEQRISDPAWGEEM
jgi:replicative DNA helicase